jgi:dienelactone hydrolase
MRIGAPRLRVMARVVLFHSAQGLRPAVLEWAGGLEDAGHEVWAPDLFEGETFDRLEAGIAHRDAVGIPELMRRAEAALAELPEDLVYAGFSMGAASAGYYAATRPGARGAVLMHGVTPLAQFGVEAWPADVPVQVHYAADDPHAGADALPALEATVTAAPAPIEVFTYPGSDHLFSDRDSPESDEVAAALMFERVLAFLAE